jgi:hypothetical protein
MADIVLSEAEADRLVALPKRITQQNHWQERDGNYVMDLPVEADEQLPLRLYGRFNPRTNVFNFIFFFDKFRVRRSMLVNDITILIVITLARLTCTSGQTRIEINGLKNLMIHFL